MIYGIPATKFFETFVALAAQKGLSPSVAAEKAGLNRSAVTTWKKGRIPGEATLSKLTAYFGVTRKYLLEGPPVESETESEFESYEKLQEDTPETTDVFSADTLEGGSRLESRSFVKFALNLLTIYHPDETVESLARQLKISPNAFKALEDDCFDKVPVDADWGGRFYSLLEDKNVPQILKDLEYTCGMLRSQRGKSILNKIPQVIWDYMYQKHLDFEFDKSAEHPHIFRHGDLNLVRLKNSGKHWVFYFREFKPDVLRSYQIFVERNYKLINNVPDMERFIIMLMYAPDSVSRDELSRFERELCKTYSDRMNVLFPNTQFFLLQINSTTGEIMKENQMGLSSLTDFSTD